MEFFSEIGNWLFENESAISALAGLLAIVVILGVPLKRLLGKLGDADRKAATTPTDSTSDRPSILVLPFDDLSKGNKNSAVVDGFTEDLTTRLAKMSGYFVFARNTAFSFKGQGQDVQAIGAELGARYVLEGSIRPLGDQTRITAQLIDSNSGTHLWAEKFDRPSNDLTSALDELAQMIALQLGAELTRAEASLAQSIKPADQGSWELYQQAKSILMSVGWSESSFAQITELVRKAIKADPDYAPAHAYLSLILAMGHWVKLMPDQQAAHDDSLACAEKALELAPNSSEVLGYVGCAFSDLGYGARGIPIIERAIELDPSNAQAFAALGAAKIISGELDSGIAELEHAIKLSPRDAGYAPWSTLLSFGFALKGDNDKSLEWARSACQSDTCYFLGHLAYARALAQAGQRREAEQSLAEAKRQYPALDKAYVSDFMGSWVCDQFEQAGIALN